MQSLSIRARSLTSVADRSAAASKPATDGSSLLSSERGGIWVRAATAIAWVQTLGSLSVIDSQNARSLVSVNTHRRM